MNEVSKQQFKEIYFQYGREADGWGQAYWDKFFEHDKPVPMKYRIEEPASPQHNRMMIVSDFGAREYRLFFMTEESEDSFSQGDGEPNRYQSRSIHRAQDM